MQIIATNIGRATTITFNGKQEQTGIFKYPVDTPLRLGKTDVDRDTVIDRKHHAGINKACYLFSADEYDFWKKQYPELDWDWGMFGENLTVKGLNEAEIRVGDIYTIGTAKVEVSQPREPCYKLGVRFEDQKILKKFIKRGRPGTYVRIVEEGEVAVGDSVKLVKRSTNSLTVTGFYNLLYDKKKDADVLRNFMANTAVPSYKKERMQKYL